MISPSHDKKWIGLFLSGLVLPGLGQIHRGERKKGWFFVLSVLSALIITFAKFMMGVLKAAELNRYARPPSLNIGKTLYSAYQMEKTWIWVGTGLTIALWLWSVWDIGRKRSE